MAFCLIQSLLCRRARGSPWNFDFSGCSSTVSNPLLDRLQRRQRRLAKLHRSLTLPKPVSFSAFGEEFQLPLRARTTSSLGQKELEYLAGFFDGDGCVLAESTLSGCQLRINQSTQHGEVLLRFLHAFGGSIYASSGARGAQLPILAWCLGGQGCRDAALMLATVQSAKREQLKIAANWPKFLHERGQVASALVQLKRTAHPEKVVQSWAFFAGFFDAEGCIRIPAAGPSINLHVGQKHISILASMAKLIESENLAYSPRIYPRAGHYTLQVNRTGASKAILHNMIHAGLLQKKQVAELALGMTASTHYQTRERLANLVGHQGRYQRLDADGCKRSHEIRLLRSRLYRMRVNDMADTDEAQGLQLKMDLCLKLHAENSAVLRVITLRRDIRTMLQRGASRFH